MQIKRIAFLPILFLLASAAAQDSNQVTKAERQEVTVFERVEVEAEYAGEGRWADFIGSNLRADIPVKRKAPLGKYQVIVQFIVDKDGSITQVTPLTHHGYGMEEEVMRVIKKSPKWRPAMQNGRPVKAYRKQPITFEVTGK